MHDKWNVVRRFSPFPVLLLRIPTPDQEGRDKAVEMSYLKNSEIVYGW